MYMRGLGCCGGSAVAGFGAGPDIDSGSGPSEMTPMIPAVATIPDSATPYPWGKLFVTSVLAGLTLHFLTRRRG